MSKSGVGNKLNEVNDLECVLQIMEVASERHGRNINYEIYRAIAVELYPERMDQLAYRFEREGFRRWLTSHSRQALNVSEELDDAPMMQLALLPGLPSPRYINIGTQSEPLAVRVDKVSVREYQHSIAERKRIKGNLDRRIEDMELKYAWLKANCTSLDDIVGDVINYSDRSDAA